MEVVKWLYFRFRIVARGGIIMWKLIVLDVVCVICDLRGGYIEGIEYIVNNG